MKDPATDVVVVHVAVQVDVVPVLLVEMMGRHDGFVAIAEKEGLVGVAFDGHVGILVVQRHG
jgi:hypothetical protein